MAKVTLVAHTPDAESIVAAAYRVCYSPQDVGDILEDMTPEKSEDFLAKVAGFGHESPVEHASFTFAIEGVSRSLMAQITRHRIASFSVRSQRYVSMKGFAYVTPPEIEANPEALALFQNTMAQLAQAYETLAETLAQGHQQRLLAEGKSPKEARQAAQKRAEEDARFVLPGACETRMIVTLNVRSLYNFFRLRCCNRAQWEIRDLAWQMLKLCKEASPMLFKTAGPACLYGTCSEGAMSCGKADEVRKKYR